METQAIQAKIYAIRGVKIMLDQSLAELYQVKTKALNQAVKRNIDRFPDDFMFQLTQEEFSFLRSQFVTSNAQRGGKRYLPFAFTDFGIAMLSTVLKSKTAIQMNIKIIRAFIELRQQISGNPEYPLLNEKVRRIESDIETMKTNQKFDNNLIEGKLIHMSRKIHKMSQILDEFQDSHLIIKRPNEG